MFISYNLDFIFYLNAKCQINGTAIFICFEVLFKNYIKLFNLVLKILTQLSILRFNFCISHILKLQSKCKSNSSNKNSNSSLILYKLKRKLLLILQFNFLSVFFFNLEVIKLFSNWFLYMLLQQLLWSIRLLLKLKKNKSIP